MKLCAVLKIQNSIFFIANRLKSSEFQRPLFEDEYHYIILQVETVVAAERVVPYHLKECCMRRVFNSENITKKIQFTLQKSIWEKIKLNVFGSADYAMELDETTRLYFEVQCFWWWGIAAHLTVIYSNHMLSEISTSFVAAFSDSIRIAS